MKTEFICWEEAVRWLKQQPDQQELVRDCFYDDPLLEAAQRYSISNEWTEIRNIIGGGDKRSALDLGAGRGITYF